MWYWVAGYVVTGGLFYLWMYGTAKWDPTTDPVYVDEAALCPALPAAIARLPKQQRLVVQGRFYEGRSCEDLAQELGTKPAAVLALLARAVNRLRDDLPLPASA